MKGFIRLTGFGVFGILLVFAFIFFEERTIIFDTAFRLFHLIYEPKLPLEIRFSNTLFQLLPLALRKLNVSLSSILLAHSLQLALFHFIIFCLIAFVLKQHRVALMFTLFSLLLVNDTFYFHTELPIGLSFLILYYAWLRKSGIESLKRTPIVHFLCWIFIMFFHPILIIPLAFVVLYHISTNHGLTMRHLGWLGVLTFAALAIRVLAGRVNTYEAGKLHLSKRFISDALQIPALASTHKVIQYVLNDYAVFWLLFLITVFALINRKKNILAFIVTGGTIGYVLLICAAFPKADKFYMENMLLPIGVFTALPFVDFVLTGIHKKILVFGIVVIVCGLRIGFIYNAHGKYTERLNWYSSQFEKMDKLATQRLLLEEKQVNMDTIIMSWASGYETILLSSLNGPHHTKSLVIAKGTNIIKLAPYLENDSLFLPEWYVINIDKLPSKYFGLRAGKYKMKHGITSSK